MNCYQKNCPWRHNSNTNVYECDCAYTCPNRAEEPTIVIYSDHTEPSKEGGYTSTSTSKEN